MKTPINFILIICVAYLVSCSKSVSIDVEIPSTLQNNEDVVNYINQYAENVGEFRDIVAELGVMPNFEGGEIAAESLNMSNFEMVKLTMQLASITGNLQKLKAQREEIDPNLSNEQIKAFDAVCLQLDAHMAQVGDNKIDLSEIAAIQEKQAEKKAKGDSLTKALDELRGGPLGDTNENNNAKASNEISPKVAIPIMVLVIAFIIFFSIKSFIKKIKGTVQEISHSAGSIKNTAHDLLNYPQKVTGQNKELTEEEKANLELIKKHFN